MRKARWNRSSAFMFDISERQENRGKTARPAKGTGGAVVRDGLTGIANRRQFDASLERNKTPGRQPAALPALFDVDFFNNSTICTGTSRRQMPDRHRTNVEPCGGGPRDVEFACFGGEEFVILLPETDIGCPAGCQTPPAPDRETGHHARPVAARPAGHRQHRPGNRHAERPHEHHRLPGGRSPTVCGEANGRNRSRRWRYPRREGSAGDAQRWKSPAASGW